jgi:hypothetical protein
MRGRSSRKSAPSLARLAVAFGATVALLFPLGGLGGARAANPTAPARFIYERCDPAVPGGGTEGAVFAGNFGYIPGNTCAEADGALILSQGPDMGAGQSSWAVPIAATPGGSVEAVALTAQVCNGQSHDAAVDGVVLGQPWPADCVLHTRAFGTAAAASGLPLLALRCLSQCLGGPFAYAHYIAATEVDPHPPAINFTGGSLLAGGALRGHQSLLAETSDLGGGVAQVVLQVNGARYEAPLTPACKTTVVSNPTTSGTVAITPTPCPPALSASWSLDTAQPPFHQGQNILQACAQDFSTIGPAGESCTATSVSVDNSCPESAVAGGESFRAAFKASGRTTTTVRFGHGALVRGRLLDAGGQPLAAATICVASQVLAPGAPKQPLGMIATDAAGHFSYPLSPGPVRDVILDYRRDARQIEATLRYRAHARPTLMASARTRRNGQRLGFSGELNGPRRGGRVVILQAGVAGSRRWITFRRAVSDANGRFRAAYHFTATTRATDYRFRAVVPTQAGYPWVQGHSKSVRVRVSP